MFNFKPDWYNSLHVLRKEEINLIFGLCESDQFQTGLELGAGDGYQSKLLSKYINKLYSTDLNMERLDKKDTEKISYSKCDAENLLQYFDKYKFDIVFSSNLMEHLPNPASALHGMHAVLNDHGLVILTIPSPLWKIFQFFLFYPNLLLIALEKLSSINWIINKLYRKNNAEKFDKQSNNLKGKPRIFRWYLPSIHGISKNHISEFLYFKKSNWKKRIQTSGFELVSIFTGPLATGYGFGFNSLRLFLTKFGLSSEYVYVFKKKGCLSKYENCFK